MRILYLNDAMHVGGVSKCILKLCKELKNDNYIVVASHKGELVHELNDMNIKYYEIFDVENKSPINIILNIKKIIKIIKSEKIDIIHSHHRMTTLLAKISKKFTGVKVIHTQHLCIEDKFKLTKLTLNNIKAITVSESAKRILEEKSKLNGENIKTIYNTIETKNDNKVVDQRLIDLKENGYFVVGQVSRIIDYKGIYDFVDIAKATIKENSNIRFIFIGDGVHKENLCNYIKQHDMEKYIIMLGNKDNVIEHLRYIDTLLLCSYIEGLPLAPLEAFSQGIPVIATNIDGTNEEIQHGYNGYLISPKDIDGFKNNILKLFNDKELLNKFKDNAYKSYIQNFNTEKYIKEHNNIYNELI